MIIAFAAMAQSVHEHLQAKYGAVSMTTFGKFLNSPEFRNLLAEKSPRSRDVAVLWYNRNPNLEKAPRVNCVTVFPEPEGYMDTVPYGPNGERLASHYSIDLKIVQNSKNPE